MDDNGVQAVGIPNVSPPGEKPELDSLRTNTWVVLQHSAQADEEGLHRMQTAKGDCKPVDSHSIFDIFVWAYSWNRRIGQMRRVHTSESSVLSMRQSGSSMRHI